MQGRVKVGCCGIPISLGRYASTFDVVEVQQSFYQPPAPSTLEQWNKKVPGGFEFTLKAWQLITHEASSPTYRRLREKLDERQRREAGSFRSTPVVMMAWRRTLDCARALGTRWILFQCPARFTPTPQNQANLRRFFREIEPSRGRGAERLAYVWEPRGESKASDIRELCEELDLVHGVDPFQQRPVTAGPAYFRLHGRMGYGYRYTETDLKQLLEKVRPFDSSSVFFNNISMLEDARSFQKLITDA